MLLNHSIFAAKSLIFRIVLLLLSKSVFLIFNLILTERSRWQERVAARRGACPPRAKRTLEGSFSAVSKPNFARKYALESSRRDLNNALLCTALQAQFFIKSLPNVLLNLAKLFNSANFINLLSSKISEKIHKILATF